MTERSTLVRHTSLFTYTIPPAQYKLEMALNNCSAVRLCIAIATRPVCLSWMEKVGSSKSI